MRYNLFGVSCSVATRETLLTAIETGESVRVATPNPEILLAARESANLRGALGEMTHCLVDGAGVSIWWNIARIFYKLPPVTRTPGATFCEELLARYQDGSRSFAFLGSAPGVAEQASKNLRLRFPKLRVVFAEDGGVPTADGALAPDVVERLLAAKPDITFVTFGAPKQELVIQRLSDTWLPALLGVGGSLHFFVDRPRAPKVLRAIGLEWFWRLATVPGHWRRVWRAVGVFSWAAALWILTGGPRQSVVPSAPNQTGAQR